MTWIHTCVAIDSTLNHLTVVSNGRQLEDQAFPIPPGAQPPSNLTGKLLIFKLDLGVWYQSKHKVSNLNIFSKMMSLSEMMRRTDGNDCGKADGDYLSWESAEWVLEGKPSLGEVTVEDLCRRESRIQVFTATVQMDQCQNLCKKMNNATIPAMRTQTEYQEMVERVNEVLYPNDEPTKAGTMGLSTWASILRTTDGSWVDLYSRNPLKELSWAKGQPATSTSRCAIYATPWKGLADFTCTTNLKIHPLFCPCYFTPVPPQLTLRGLCPDSHIDQAFLPRNDPGTGHLHFYGSKKTIATFDGKKWKMLTAFFNTTALTDAKPNTFILGKHNWSISRDSEECHSGKPYTTQLKLTGCDQGGEFTCDDGQCVKMLERCNQVPDCRDESDERKCKLVVFKEGYNKNIPPIKKAANGGVSPANVYISITLMKVVEIEETDHSIHLQFQISLTWNENRVQYQNLKTETSLNSLTDNDIMTLWLPLIVYDNTDQKEVTRLGEYGNGEWATRVTVTREGNFTRSSIEEVDEAEIFEGAENRLTMNQTYTWEFQCKYDLQHYPFDTQAINKTILPFFYAQTQKCKIKMTVESLAMSTVKLLADKVKLFLFW